MEHLLVAALLGATVLYLYDLYVTGPAAVRAIVAHLPAFGWYLGTRPDDWRLLESYACVPISLAVVGGLQYILVLRDATLLAASMGGRRR